MSNSTVRALILILGTCSTLYTFIRWQLELPTNLGAVLATAGMTYWCYKE